MSVPHICFDRILPRDIYRLGILDNPSRAISPIGKAWINGSTLKIGFLGGGSRDHNHIKSIAPEWTNHANLSFAFVDYPDADIRISFANSGAWSYIGTDAKNINWRRATMNFGFIDDATILHEFGHAIGLAHEHQNPEGGIQWNEDAVIRDLSGPPNYWDEATIRHNVLDRYSRDQIHGTEFDPESIMLYQFPADWTLNGFQADANEILSSMDEQFIASAEMYPGVDVPTQPAEVEIGVSTIETIPASIGQPGEEDLFTFVATSQDRYTIETEGTTDVFMKLFGADKTKLIATDDDSGYRTNAKIEQSLEAGRYYVQVRHYAKDATGAYGIRVVKN